MKNLFKSLLLSSFVLGFFHVPILGHSQEIIRNQLLAEHQNTERNLVENDSSESNPLKNSRPSMQQSNLTISVDCMAQYYKHLAECLKSGKSEKVCYNICGGEFWDCYGEHPEEGPTN